MEKQDHEKALRLSQVDPLMRSIRESNPLVAAVYFNSWDSYNRIYPFFMTPEQYPHDMVIPNYNFYYLADAKHNPQRRPVWTEVYLDPAGQGWMMSAIAPVYRDEFLEGVVGLDVTVGQMLAEIGSLQVPWQGYALLVGRDNGIMALPAAGEKDFALRELTSYSYAEAVSREVLKPADFKLDRQEGLRPLQKAMAERPHGVQEVQLGGRAQLMAWSEIPQTGWRLLLVVDEANIFRETNRLAEQYLKIGYLLIAGLVFFYLLFGSWMWLRSRRLSDELAQPITGIVGMMRSLAVGERRPAAPPTVIQEMAEMAEEVQHAGQQLQASEESRLQVQRTLELVRRLRTGLTAIDGVEVVGDEARPSALMAFRIEGWPAADAADELSHRAFAITDPEADGEVLRVSVGAWNTEEELDRFASRVGELAASTPETLPRRPALTVIGGPLEDEPA